MGWQDAPIVSSSSSWQDAPIIEEAKPAQEQGVMSQIGDALKWAQKQQANVLPGAIRGAGSIGATLLQLNDAIPLTPIGQVKRLIQNGGKIDPIGDWNKASVASKQTRADIDSSLQSLGADHESLGYGAGKLGAEILGTAGVGGLLSKGVQALSQAPRALRLAKALETGGMVTGANPVGFLPKVANMGTRILGGAGSGAAMAGIVDPEQADTGAIIGAAMPPAAFLAGKVGDVGGKVWNGISGKIPAEKQALNALRDATLAEGRQAGYVVPPSAVNPTFLGNRMESLGGKAAIKQQATFQNQDVTNALAAKALGIPKDTPISLNLLDSIRKTASQPYQEVGNLSKSAKDALEIWKQSASDAKGLFNHYNRTADPSVLVKAKEARALNDLAYQEMLDQAKAAGRNDLISSLQESRKLIAKTYDVERALNSATGEISAPIIGRLYGKAPKRMTEELATIGKFQNAFPQYMRPGAVNPTAGVSALEPMASAGYAMAGSAATGNPLGLLAGGLPLIRGPARAAALSKVMQKAPRYSSPSAMHGLLSQEIRQIPYYAAPVALSRP